MNAITVVIGNYNYERFLGEAIESALAQENADVLVIDDGSTDHSREIIDRYGERVRKIYKENQGQSSVYNLALALVNTEYVLFLDSDDVLYPDATRDALRAFAGGDFVKVQFRLDVIGDDGAQTGAYVPNSVPPRDCAALLRRGWLYPSPPASGNVYRVSALRSIFPIPMQKQHRKAADFFAIYGVALTGSICALQTPLGAYRVHRKVTPKRGESAGQASLAIGNCETGTDVESSFPWRWDTLREMIRTSLNTELSPRFYDFSYEKNRLCIRLYDAPLLQRWRVMMFDAGHYFHALVFNPFWSVRKKLGALALTLLCLAPSRRLSGFAVRYIANPVTRHERSASAVSVQREEGARA
ncbi:glycosyltransferase family 2 protein [Paraburkholderia bannensis]|uniref:glycosyltransferase family 2 protein n=1 Tax=Paraburkholderia bannensis TaxID=765414 RepID=UPI002AB7984C|nr:glycosyltransferase family A protein [Paraburkholderia bannensis]